jgi:hypothetical protein
MPENKEKDSSSKRLLMGAKEAFFFVFRGLS